MSEERDRHAIAHRLHDAKLPRMKTLDELEFARAPQIPAAKVRELAEGGYITRAERAALIVTTNLPFSEWTQVFPNPRLCKALLDRITDRRISSRPERNRTAFGARWRDGRRRKPRKNSWASGFSRGVGRGRGSDAAPSPETPSPLRTQRWERKGFMTRGWAKSGCQTQSVQRFVT